jgi:hypothetical protein
MCARQNRFIRGELPTMAHENMIDPIKAPEVLPSLTWLERLRARIRRKEELQAEIKRYENRLRAMQGATDEALSNALLFENEDFTRWLKEIANTDKGALGWRIQELEGRNRELEKRNAELAPSERKAWETVEAVIEAWEYAAGTKTGRWDVKKKEWVVDVRSPVLPQTVIDALTEWINRDKPVTIKRA